MVDGGFALSRPASAAAVGDASPSHAARTPLARCLTRLQQASDFPALSATVSRVQALSLAENDSLSSLCDEILRDVALTTKLLRVVNSALYRRSDADPICTVSRAVSLMGLSEVRHLALSLVLLDRLPNRDQAGHIQSACLQVLMASTLAQGLAAHCGQAHIDGEEAFLTTLFRRLGLLLVTAYLPQEAQAMRDLAEASPARDWSQAALVVLGVDGQELASAVAQGWGLPEGLTASMRDPVGEPPRQALPHGQEALSWLACLAHASADLMLLGAPTQLQSELQALERRFAPALGLPAGALSEAASHARGLLGHWVKALQIRLPASSPVERLMDTGYEDAPPVFAVKASTHAPPRGLGARGDERPGADLSGWGELDAYTPQALALDGAPDEALAWLAQGVEDGMQALLKGRPLEEILCSAMEAIWRGLACQRVILCLRESGGQALQGRIGLGTDAQLLKAAFRIPLQLDKGQSADLFTLVSLKQVDVMLESLHTAALQSRLPPWFTRHVRAPAIMLLPLALDGSSKTVGLIYADRAQAQAWLPDPRVAVLLKVLRQQILLGMRLARGKGEA